MASPWSNRMKTALVWLVALAGSALAVLQWVDAVHPRGEADRQTKAWIQATPTPAPTGAEHRATGDVSAPWRFASPGE